MGNRIQTQGVPYSAIERVQLSSAWLEVSEDGLVGTDQNCKEFFAAVAANFQKRMDRMTSFVASTGLGTRVVREAGALQRYYQKLF